MLGAAAMAISATPRLMKPTPKMSARFLRSAIGRVAQEEGLDFMTLEDIYTNVRSSLAHLVAHDRYRTHMEDKVSDLVRKTEQLLACPGVEKLSRKKNWMQDLARTVADLDGVRQEMLTASAVTPQSIIHFLKVVEAAREVHLAEHCDPSGITTAPLYTLAHMVVGNFEAYNKTLNT